MTTQSPPRRGSTRRAFLRSAGAIGAAVAASPLALPSDAQAFGLLQAEEAPEPDREVPTFCELCFWNCGVVARAKGNRVLALRGHVGYPTSKGKLCARGNAGAAFVTDEDRLRYPMVRVGERGQGRFERIGWHTAYRKVAHEMQRIKAQYGPEALALFYHGTGGPMLRTMMVAFGTPNFAGPAYAQCKGARNVGYGLTYGVHLPSPEPLDFERTRCMVLFGSHLGENAHNSQVQGFVQARARGAKLVVLDPRMSTAAARADLWLPVRPGSDLAVILAWIHLLVRDGTYDRDFVERSTVGFDALARHVQSFTPAWASEQAAVPEAHIVAAYTLMRESMPAVLVHPGRHTSWYGEADTQRARGQAILTALLGAWWRPGGLLRIAKPTVADFPGPDFPDLPPHVDAAAKRFPFADEVTTNGIREATRTGKPYPIKGWYVHGSNLIQSMPGRKETLEAISKLDLLVVSDIMPTEIVDHADIVLPEDTYLERWDDLLLGSDAAPFIGLRQPVVRPAHDTRPAWRIAKELGTELGVGDFFAFDTFEQYLETRLAGSGTDLATLRKTGVFAPKPTVSPVLDADEELELHTPSKKVELYSQRLADAGFSPLPVYQPQPLPPAGTWRLLYGRSPLHTFGRTQNNAILHDLAPTNALWMSRETARSLGVADGDPVMVGNHRTAETGPLPARVTERMPDDAVYMVHGFGHTARHLGRARGVGADDSAVITDYAVDPISGSTGMRTQFVTVRQARAEEIG